MWRSSPRNLNRADELWTTRLLARHAREHEPAEGHPCLAKLAQGTLCNILNEQEIKPHKVRYYLERRDPEFKQKMRSEEHTSELQSHLNLVCRLLLEKKKIKHHLDATL